MLYTRTSELALRAALYLALQPPGKLSPVYEIARGTGLPAPYLSKIMRRLICAGLVRAFRGPGGGLELGRAPEEITLWSLAQALDGAVLSDACVLGLRACSAETPCPVHERWFPLRQQMQRLLEETTLESLARGLRGVVTPNSNSWVQVSAAAPARQSRNRGDDHE